MSFPYTTFPHLIIPVIRNIKICVKNDFRRSKNVLKSIFIIKGGMKGAKNKKFFYLYFFKESFMYNLSHIFKTI